MSGVPARMGHALQELGKRRQKWRVPDSSWNSRLCGGERDIPEAYVTNRSHHTVIPTNVWAQCKTGRSAHSNGFYYRSPVRREHRWLDHSTIARRHETCLTAASQLHSHHYYHNDRPRHHFLLQCGVSLHTTSYPKSKFVGWDQFNYNPVVHEWPHV